MCLSYSSCVEEIYSGRLAPPAARSVPLRLTPVQQHGRGEGQRQAEGGGTVEALVSPEEGGDRVQRRVRALETGKTMSDGTDGIARNRSSSECREDALRRRSVLHSAARG